MDITIAEDVTLLFARQFQPFRQRSLIEGLALSLRTMDLGQYGLVARLKHGKYGEIILENFRHTIEEDKNQTPIFAESVLPG